MKINYIIATWNGIRVKPVQNKHYYEQVLRNHLKILNGFSNSVSQITIMKPYSGIKNMYYDIEITDKIKIVDCENKYQSYGQWLKAVELFLDDFDYFIFIEDDYVPATNNFDTKLINIYEEGTYLCTRANGIDAMYHCQVSNGIISNKTIRDVISNIKYSIWIDNYGKKYPDLIFRGTNHQRAFSRYFHENGIILKDYLKYYMADFLRVGNEILDYSLPETLNKEKIFTPIQTIYPY